MLIRTILLYQFLLLSITLLMYTIHQTVLYTVAIQIILILLLLDYLLLMNTTLLLLYLLMLLDMDYQSLLMVCHYCLILFHSYTYFSQYNCYR